MASKLDKYFQQHLEVVVNSLQTSLFESMRIYEEESAAIESAWRSVMTDRFIETVHDLDELIISAFPLLSTEITPTAYQICAADGKRIVSIESLKFIGNIVINIDAGPTGGIASVVLKRVALGWANPQNVQLGSNVSKLNDELSQMEEVIILFLPRILTAIVGQG